MLSNERFALECRARYEAQGLIVDASNGEFAHSPLTRKECETGYYLLHGDHQHQGLLQSRDLGKCCFFAPDVKRWLENFAPSIENSEELWDIYREGTKRHNEELHAEKNEEGKSLLGLRSAEKTHAAKDEEGRSLHALRVFHSERNEEGKSLLALENIKKVNEKTHREKDENGKSKHAVRSGKRLHAAKDENGKSLHTLRVNAQVWESTVDGFRSNAGGVANHNKANGWDPAARVRIS
jgi:hypothetical protein